MKFLFLMLFVSSAMAQSIQIPIQGGTLTIDSAALATATSTDWPQLLDADTLFTPTPPPPPPPPPPASNCGMVLGSAVTFCATFPASAGNGVRQGALDANVWGVSRTSGIVNFGQQQWNVWSPVSLDNCDGTPPLVLDPNDVVICHAQLREAMNDEQSVTTLAMYPKQPFNFAGRTGTVSFDVSNDTAGSHAAWPEFWMSDLPVPAPFTHFGSWQALPANGFGIRFAAAADPGQYGLCPNGNNLGSLRWTVHSSATVRLCARRFGSLRLCPTLRLRRSISSCHSVPAAT